MIVVDPGFPRRGRQRLRAAPSCYVVNFFQILHENKESLAGGGTERVAYTHSLETPQHRNTPETREQSCILQCNCFSTVRTHGVETSGYFHRIRSNSLWQVPAGLLPLSLSYC